MFWLSAWMLTDVRGCRTEVRDGWTSLATSPAAAQLLSMPICTCSFHSDPMSLSYQLSFSGSVPGPSDRHMDELWLDPNHLSAKQETDEFRW